MTFLFKDPGAFHGKKLRIQPLIQHELQRIHLCTVNCFNRVLSFKSECTLTPGEQREYDIFNLFPHNLFDYLL